ncbi:MAG: ABC transporter ATP-binding protein [Ruminococcus sp.]|nr:ABC transporter ATP-binding protein [Ruminococcus sp.]
MSQLTCTSLSLGYEGKEILSNLSFSVEAGDYVCILGENGSGKTTLMRTILGLHKPMKGSISTGDGLNRREIGYLPQQNSIQRDFPATVREIVISGFQGQCGFRPFYTREQKRRADENIELMGISHLKNRCYRELSGGQQQRVLLARALCATRKMLFLDEPVAGLDPKVTQEMYALIEKLNKELGITIIMISHDIRAAIQFSNKILHIGSEIFFGSRDEYIKRAASEWEGNYGNL